jgi:hypothetical protein
MVRIYSFYGSVDCVLLNEGKYFGINCWLSDFGRKSSRSSSLSSSPLSSNSAISSGPSATWDFLTTRLRGHRLELRLGPQLGRLSMMPCFDIYRDKIQAA